MGREEKNEDEAAGPEAAYNVSNTWSAMLLSGHIGSVLGFSIALLLINALSEEPKALITAVS